jgi:VWFA-related protein
MFFAIGFAVMARQDHAAAQAPPAATFKAEVEYVEVDALVTDKDGRFVRGLRQEDFQIFEDGRPQKIASFAMVDIPARASAPETPRQVERDVQTSERPFAGRLYVLVLDDLHTAAERSQLVRNAARRFIERHMTADDRMAIVHADRRAGAAQDFTGSKRLLLAAVDRFMGQKLESATLARNTDFLRSAPAGRVDDPVEIERGFNARATLRVLREVSDWLSRVHGRRKSIVFISEGIDYDISDVFNNRSATSIIEDTREAVAAATRSNVTIYAVNARAITGVADDAMDVSIFADQIPVQRRTDDGALERAPGINSRTLENELRLSHDSLRTIADETNGLAAITSADFTPVFDRIVRDNSSYYVLAYYPASSKRDGRFHRIEVRTSNPALVVRARRGYMAPRGKGASPAVAENDGASTAVLEALNSPIPADGVGLRAFAVPFKGAAPNASVVLGIELRGRDLPIQQGGRVELSYAAVDAASRTRGGDTEALTLALPPEAKARVEQNGLQILNRLELPPGRYQLRIAARNVVSGALGALSYDLDVPDFHQLPLSMSGVLLTSLTGAAGTTARGDPQLQKVMPAAPVSRRIFSQEEELLVFAEVYDQQRNIPHTVDIRTVVHSPEGGQPLFQNAEERSSHELQGDRGAYHISTRIAVSKLNAGRYVLTVEATSRLGPTASRQIPFEVR